MENPRYKHLYFNVPPANPVSVQKTTAMGITELPLVRENKNLKKRRAKNKVARKARRVNKRNRRK